MMIRGKRWGTCQQVHLSNVVFGASWVSAGRLNCRRTQGLILRDKVTIAPAHGRLYDHAKKVASKLEAARAAQAHPKDDATGAPFFAPQVGRAPAYARNHAALPIGDYLYGMRCAAASTCGYDEPSVDQAQLSTCPVGLDVLRIHYMLDFQHVSPEDVVCLWAGMSSRTRRSTWRRCTPGSARSKRPRNTQPTCPR